MRRDRPRVPATVLSVLLGTAIVSLAGCASSGSEVVNVRTPDTPPPYVIEAPDAAEAFAALSPVDD